MNNVLGLSRHVPRHVRLPNLREGRVLTMKAPPYPLSSREVVTFRDDPFRGHSDLLPKYELSSRPKRSEVEGPAVLSTCQRMLNESTTLPFVIPSEAEGSAVQRLVLELFLDGAERVTVE